MLISISKCKIYFSSNKTTQFLFITLHVASCVNKKKSIKRANSPGVKSWKIKCYFLCSMFQELFFQKTKKVFSERDVFSSNVTRENKSVHENLVRTVWIPRCTGCIFSFPSHRCDVLYLLASTSTTWATNMSGAFCEVHHHFGGSMASLTYTYIF